MSTNKKEETSTQMEEMLNTNSDISIKALKFEEDTIVMENLRLQDIIHEKDATISSLNVTCQSLTKDRDTIISELNIKSDEVTELESIIKSQQETLVLEPQSRVNVDQILIEISSLKSKLHDDSEQLKTNHENIMNIITSNHNTSTELFNRQGCHCTIA